ncbi:transcription termination/antitermination protein NusA [Clostridia bacterium]|nr:transcription termination/antitermination protein NusA [Clostridia bacterium]GHV11078.1 transcription termination/antitermination protein NusA [Clostridia bacterium]
MNAELFDALDMLESEKNIKKDYMLAKIESAIIAAYKKNYNNNANVKVHVDTKNKTIKVYRLLNVVDDVEDPLIEIDLGSAKKINSRYDIGSVAEVEETVKNFGRISAQNAKQIIVQAMREAERENMVKEYENKRDELISATVYKMDPHYGDAILSIGKGEAVLRASEQIPGEVLVEGQRIKVYVTEVREGDGLRGSPVIISRKNAGLVRRLFEQEIPEIHDGTVLINEVAREAGSRTKIAVSSQNPDVDPIGTCIGPKGARINAIVGELGSEKIDIISYSKNSALFVRAALQPATVIDVNVDEEKRYCEIIVAPDQLSLAIGRDGQNARLAAKLTGYKIDIKAEVPFDANAKPSPESEEVSESSVDDEQKLSEQSAELI